jgi:hypothetical protein
MANTKAVEIKTQAVSPVSIFGGAGAAAAAGAGAVSWAAGASIAGAPASCAHTAPAQRIMARQAKSGRLCLVIHNRRIMVPSFFSQTQNK